MSFLEKIFGPSNQWEMDPNHKVEWQTDYGNFDVSTLEKDLIRDKRKSDLFFAKLNLGSTIAKNAIKKFFKVKTDAQYEEVLRKLIEVESEAILLDAPRDGELFEKLNNIMSTGVYDPNYDHEAYIAKAKANSIYK